VQKENSINQSYRPPLSPIKAPRVPLKLIKHVEYDAIIATKYDRERQYDYDTLALQLRSALADNEILEKQLADQIKVNEKERFWQLKSAPRRVRQIHQMTQERDFLDRQNQELVRQNQELVRQNQALVLQNQELQNQALDRQNQDQKQATLSVELKQENLELIRENWN